MFTESEIIQEHKTILERETGKEVLIILIDKIDRLLPKLTLTEIARAVNKYLPEGHFDIRKRCRKRQTVDLRKTFCLLAQKAGYHLREIGAFLDGRDHTTIIHNIEWGKRHLEKEEEFFLLYNRIQKDLVDMYESRLAA